jgi:DNA-binding SARP family transcriptional activator
MVSERPGFRVLGPMTLSRDGQLIPITGTKPRAVLAHLLIHRGKPVTAAALVDELWRDRPPATAGNTVQTYIRQLRNLLEPGRPAGRESQTLRTIPGGYILDIQSDELDSAIFERLLSQGRQALRDDKPEKARELLDTGLALWHGPPFAQLHEFPTAAHEASRLEQLRLDAIELRVEADLRLGRHAELVDELTELVQQHPLRDSLVGHLMLALYRCGRQSESLTAYETLRHRLNTELGADPHPSLRELHQQVLRQDPTLDPPPQHPTQQPTDNPTTQPHRTATRQTAGRRPATIATLTLIIAAAGILVSQGWTDIRGTPAAAPPAPTIFNEYDLAVSPGMGYDLDIPVGQPPDWHSTNNPRSPDYNYLDLYRTSPKSPRDQLSGVDLTNTNEFNAVHQINTDDPPTTCHTLPTHGGGNAPIEFLHSGSKVCIRTHDNRWAMLTITQTPTNRNTVLLLHVTVLPN